MGPSTGKHPLLDIYRVGPLPRVVLDVEEGHSESPTEECTTSRELVLSQDGTVIWSDNPKGFGEPYRYGAVSPEHLLSVLQELRDLVEYDGHSCPGLSPGSICSLFHVVVDGRRRELASRHELNPPGMRTHQGGTGRGEYFSEDNWSASYREFRQDWQHIRRICEALVAEAEPGRLVRIPLWDFYASLAAEPPRKK